MSQEFERKYLEHPAIICGYPKSGTTLMLSLLDNHPELNTFPEELKYFKIVSTKRSIDEKIELLLNKTGAYLPSLGAFTLPSGYRDYSNINGEEYINSLKSELKNASLDRDLYLSVFKNWENFSLNKTNSYKFKYFVEKTPHNEQYWEVIKSWFPSAKFIYVVRDPRDNYLSYNKRHDNLLSIEDFVSRWKFSLERLNGIPKEDLLIVKYEDLVTRSRIEMQSVANFLEIDFSMSMLEPTRNGIPWKGNSMFGVESGSIHRASAKRYEKYLNKETVLKLEEYLFDELSKLNYNIHYGQCKKNFPKKYIIVHLLRRFLNLL